MLISVRYKDKVIVHEHLFGKTEEEVIMAYFNQSTMQDEALRAVIMSCILWDKILCSPLKVDQCFRALLAICFMHVSCMASSSIRGNIILQNISCVLVDYTALYSKGQSSSNKLLTLSVHYKFCIFNHLCLFHFYNIILKSLVEMFRQFWVILLTMVNYD
jgi:hypothetical protein